MNDVYLSIEETRPLNRECFCLRLSGDLTGITAPGQFVDLELPGLFLRRPISVCDWTDESLTLLVRMVGSGTRALAALPKGTQIKTLTGLGNGFDLSKIPEEQAILVGGGIGCAPLYGLLKRMKSPENAVVALGFRTKDDAIWCEEFKALGATVAVATEDGSLGLRGFVTEAVRAHAERSYVFACGPTPMLRALDAVGTLRGGQMSLEARMGCGFGACMGCSIETKSGMRRVCKDGPVFDREVLLWQS